MTFRATHRRALIYLTIAAAMALVLPFLGGCQGKSIAAAQLTYNAAIRHVNAEYDAGHIDQKTWDTVIAPARDASKTVLDELVDAYLTERPFDWRSALRRFYEILTPIQRQREISEASP